MGVTMIFEEIDQMIWVRKQLEIYLEMYKLGLVKDGGVSDSITGEHYYMSQINQIINN